MSPRHRIRRTWVALMGVPLTVALVAGSSPAHAAAVERHAFAGRLVDLQPGQDGVFDGATAKVLIRSRGDVTRFNFRVYGVDWSAAGTTYGVHLHVGPCVAGNGAAAGPHYNTSALAGDVPPVVDTSTEVWLDTTVRGHGRGQSHARVPFVPEPGERSIVIHEMATKADGTAGARLACLPLRLG